MRALALTKQIHLTMATAAAAFFITGAVPAGVTQGAAQKAGPGTAASANRTLRSWPAGPQLAGQEMMAKYGAPQEITDYRLIWHDAGPFTRILLTREEIPHNFPLTHKDYLEHTIRYKVPTDRTDDVHAFDASITIHPGSGELSARCDLESNNVLTLNLAHDVIGGKKSVDEARKEFGEAVSARTMGNPPASTMALQFKPMTMQMAAEVEATTIPGTSQRAGPDRKPGESGKPVGTSGMSADPMKPGSDAEIMALVIALDENEVHAAMTAQHKKVDALVTNFAKTLHQAHGKDIADVQQLGMEIDITPMETAAVDRLHATGAAQLAKIVPLTGDEFERGFVAQMVAGHREALQMVDQFMTTAKNEALKKHLGMVRQHIDMHLKQAQKLQKQ